MEKKLLLQIVNHMIFWFIYFCSVSFSFLEKSTTILFVILIKFSFDIIYFEVISCYSVSGKLALLIVDTEN